MNASPSLVKYIICHSDDVVKAKEICPIVYVDDSLTPNEALIVYQQITNQEPGFIFIPVV
jgi:hypothetical protein